MSDIFSVGVRSAVMSRVKRADTPQEILVRKYLFSQGFRFRKNYKRLAGSPDIVLPKYKTVVFVHGCFWHGHKCKLGKAPKSNQSFWTPKINSNKERDKRKNNELRKLGWNVLTVWQCQLNKKAQIGALEKLKSKIRSSHLCPNSVSSLNYL